MTVATISYWGHTCYCPPANPNPNPNPNLRRADRVAVLEVAEQSAGAIDDRHGAHLRGREAAVRGVKWQ